MIDLGAKKRLKFFAFWFFGACSLFAQDSKPSDLPKTLSDLLNTALAQSMDYKTAVLDVEDAWLAIPEVFKLKESSISSSMSVESEDDSSAFTIKNTLTLPVFDQLSFSASLNSDLSSQLALNINPLVHDASREKAVVAWKEKALEAEQSARDARTDGAACFFDLLNAVYTLSYTQSSVELKQDAWEDARKINSLSPETVSLDDVRTAFTDLLDARSAYANAQISLSDAQDAWQELFGFEVPEDDYLFALSKELEEELPLIRSTVPSSLARLLNSSGSKVDFTQKPAENTDEQGVLAIQNKQVEALAVQLARLAWQAEKLSLDSTWLIEPDLNLTGSVDIDKSGDLDWAATLSFSIAPLNVQDKARNSIQKRLDLLQRKLELAQESAARTVKELCFSLLLAQENVSNAQEDLEDVNILVQESQALLKAGEASKLELAELELSQVQAQNSLREARQNEYSAWLALYSWIGLNP